MKQNKKHTHTKTLHVKECLFLGSFILLTFPNRFENCLGTLFYNYKWNTAKIELHTSRILAKNTKPVTLFYVINFCYFFSKYFLLIYIQFADFFSDISNFTKKDDHHFKKQIFAVQIYKFSRTLHMQCHRHQQSETAPLLLAWNKWNNLCFAIGLESYCRGESRTVW